MNEKHIYQDDCCEHCEDNVYVESYTEIELMCDDGIPRPYDYSICEGCLEEFKKTNPEYIQAKEWRIKNEFRNV